MSPPATAMPLQNRLLLELFERPQFSSHSFCPVFALVFG